MENSKGDLALEIIALRSRRLQLQRLMLSDEWGELTKEEQNRLKDEAKQIDEKLKELLKILNSVGG
jgi:hypothetical protein